jgi:hypothetical protein
MLYCPSVRGMHGHAHMHAACAACGWPTATALVLHTVSVTVGYAGWRKVRPVGMRLSIPPPVSRPGLAGGESEKG